MNIFVKIKNSIYSPKYYGEVLGKPFSYSLKYLLAFALLFALVFTIVVTIKFIPVVNMLSEKAPTLASYFPQDLTVTIKDGKASTNVAEPYFIKMPKDWKDNGDKLSKENVEINGMDAKDVANMENLIVINTKEKFDIDKFNSYKTAVLLTADNVVYLDENNISIASLSDVKSFTLNREKVAGFINMVKPFFAFLYPIVFVGAFMVGYMSVVLKMVYLLFGALLIWLVTNIEGIKLGYKKSYIVGMQLMTGAIIVTSVLDVISPKFTFAFLFSILLVISAFTNLRKNTLPEATTAPTD